MRLAALLVALVVVAGCGDTNIYQNPLGPSPPGAPATRHSIEFRVSGNANGARIRFADPVDGITQVLTALPYVVEASTTQATIFLSLDVTPTAYPFAILAPFLSAQIVVDGALFREATSADTSLNTLSVSGTWRAD